jgi:glyoxylase-like metal-dependent hydrolase (beta-lactamase superfamily II)
MKAILFTIAMAIAVTTFAQQKNKNKMEQKLKVIVFKGETATVNSYIFSNGKSQIIMDVLRSSAEAKELAKQIKANKLPLTHILISHGHPDHYLGMDVLLKEFPTVKIVVATQAIKEDIKNFSVWMESVGWLDAEVNLKAKTDKNPDGFDYDKNITVLNDNKLTLDGGGALLLETMYNPAEAEHLTTVFSKDLNALFTSDFCYNDVHLWLGTGVDKKHIQNWKNQLADFKKKYATSKPTIYPGHGKKSDVTLFDKVIQYITDFEKVTSKATTKKQAMDEMIKLYPTWKQADFLLLYSVDFHVKE